MHRFLGVMEKIHAKLFVERLNHRHTYPTLTRIDATHIRDRADRTTVLGQADLKTSVGRFFSLGAWQGVNRSHDGAQFRFAEPLTGAKNDDTWIGLLGWERNTHTFTLGVGHGRVSQQSRLTQPRVLDLEEQWLLMARPGPDFDIQRTFVRTRWESTFAKQFVAQISTDFGWYERSGKVTSGNITAESYQGTPVRLTIWDAANPAAATQHVRAQLRYEHDFAGWMTQWMLALDYDAVSSNGSRRASFILSGSQYFSPQTLGGRGVFRAAST